MPHGLLLQEHLCLTFCSDVCVQPLTASSSRCPGQGHLLLVSMLVEVLLLHCARFLTALCILQLLLLFHALQRYQGLGGLAFPVGSKAFIGKFGCQWSAQFLS